MKRFTVALLAAALLLSGCSTGTSRPVESVAADLQSFYGQSVDWHTCDSTFECASIEAPLDWASPQQSSIQLSLIRHRATGQSEGSLLVNPGGPGGSGVGFIRDSLDYAVSPTLQQHYDIVGFDPRGVGSSSAVSCLDAAEMDSYLYDILPGTRGSADWIAEATASEQAFADACSENTGELLQFVDTQSAARDLDLIRAVLGDPKLNYLGYSYGTYLGANYAELYPERVGRMVLDGALDPAASNIDVNVAQAQGFEQQLRVYLTDCLAGTDCPFAGQSVDQAMQTIRKVLEQLDVTPLTSADGRKLGADALLTAIVYPLYSDRAWPRLSQMFAALQQGDASLAFELADGYNGRNPDGTFLDNSTEAFSAINCLDYEYDASPQAMAADRARLEAAAPVIGTFFAYGDIGCAVWPYQTRHVRGPIAAAGSAPIVVVGTTGDPATPYQWAVNLSEQLENATLITYQGNGHTAYNKSNACVNDAVDAYFVSGTVPAAGLTC